MSKFKKKLLVDNETAKGIRVDIRKNGVDFGGFDVRFIAGHLQSVENELTKLRKARCRELKVKELSPTENMLVLLVDYALVGWDRIEGEDGKFVPFSHADAREFFSDEDNMWIVLELLQTAMDASNYAAEEFDVLGN